MGLIHMRNFKFVVKRPAGLPVERAEYLTYYNYDVEKIRQLLDYICADTDFTKYRKRELILDWFMTVDTETSTLPPGSSDQYPDAYLSFAYLYQIRLGGCNILIRNRHDFRAFVDQVAGILNSKGITLVAYVHNLSFEWQFFKSILDVDRDSVFAIQARRIAKFTTNGGAIEWRCSYLLSNMSLEKFAENYAPPQFRKDKELIDYEVVRYPWTLLSGEILYYSIMDVVSLEASIKELMSREGDNLKTIPLTNTGYVRRDGRRACLGDNTKHYRSKEEKDSYLPFLLYRRMFCKTALTLAQYRILCDAFRGGNTHANRFFRRADPPGSGR